MASKVAVVYYSKTGNTQELAEAVGKGAEEAGAKVEVVFADDFNVKKAGKYDGVAFGSPADGDEDIQKLTKKAYEGSKPYLKDTKVALFGSWGWGGGAFLKTWEQDAKDSGLNLVGTYACKKFPEDEDIAKAQELGKKLA